MIAVVNIDGRQLKVEKNQEFYINKISGKKGDKVTLDQVLMLEKDNNKQAQLHLSYPDRKNFGHQKEMLFGENAAINLNHGPAHMLKNSEDFKS